MAEVRIYGASDDLVEVEGPLGDEWEGPGNVVFSTGDRFTVIYGDRGVWRIEHVEDSGKLSVTIERAPEGEDPDPYTDTAFVVGDFEWIDCWESWPPEREEIFDRIENQGLMNDADTKWLLAFYNTAKGRS